MSARVAPRSAARLAARKIPAADERAAVMPGRVTCVVKPTPLTFPVNCPWHREFTSAAEPLEHRPAKRRDSNMIETTTRPANENSAALAAAKEKRFDWPLCYDAEGFVQQQIDAFLARNRFARD